MAYKLFAECPCCGVNANSLEDIETIFGWRIMGNGSKIPQSYCRACRSARCQAGVPCKVNR